ncbi:Crp/Fnr family transcriptional regulator [Salinicola endophyticus]|uniref:Crp/Fnr family transcriptional regulator n=1 Tax=Salinicola endophyticus TaxID=1949083 RepID=A0ABY8FHM3_9GAMM|nr:Crp/Fnr family transcriptional regulator [Salinicola endophyticus]WFF42305.1 Crp/Fnr family transcriptional regulator [Salinicola endophyticus]
MGQQEGCLSQHFKHYGRLSDSECRRLDGLEGPALAMAKGQVFWREGDAAREFGTLSRGWAYSFRDLADGTRHILEVFMPGDVIGLREFPFKQRLSSVAMLEDGEIRLTPHRRLIEIFRDSSRLTSLCFAVASYQQALLSERLVHLSRRSARQRVAYLLFELYSRTKRNDDSIEDRFRVPLSQQQLADALGLSPVHVSRTLTAFRQEGVLRRLRGWVHLLDPGALEAEGSIVGHLHDEIELVE